MIEYIALFAVKAPGIFGFITYAIEKYLKRNIGLIAAVITASSFFSVLSMMKFVLDNYKNEQHTLVFSYPWVSSMGINFGFLMDMISLPIGLIIALISTLSCIYSIRYVEKEPNQAGYYASLLIFMTGMMGVIFSSNLIQFYLFWELMLIPSYVLIAKYGTSKRRLSVGFKYFMFTHAGALFMLLGIIYIYYYTHTLDIEELPSRLINVPKDAATVIFLLLLIGFFVKLAIFPLHTWLPDTYSEASIPVAAMLSGAMAKCGAYGIIRILLPFLTQRMIEASDFLLIFGIITIFYGGLITFSQTDIKRILAYSSISQMGYIIYGFGTASTLGIMGSLLHVINHAVCKSLLFMCAGSIIRQTGTRNVKKMRGLISRMPVTSLAFLIGALSLAGIPPLNGFWSEWMIFAGGLASGKILLTFLGVASAMITPTYFLWFAWRIFFGSASENIKEESHRTIMFPIIILALICIALGILPGLMLQFIAPAAESLSTKMS